MRAGPSPAARTDLSSSLPDLRDDALRRKCRRGGHCQLASLRAFGLLAQHSSGVPSAAASSWTPPEWLRQVRLTHPPPARSECMAGSAIFREWNRATAASRRYVRVRMKDEIDPHAVIAHDLDECGRDRLSPSLQLSRRWQVTRMRCPPSCTSPCGGSRACVAINASMPVLPVMCTSPRRPSLRRFATALSVGANNEVGAGVDGRAIFLLGPRKARIVCPQARLDMGDGNLGEGAARARPRARSKCRPAPRGGRAPVSTPSMAAITLWTCWCGSSSPGQPRCRAGYA